MFRSRGCGLLSQVSCYEHYTVAVCFCVSPISLAICRFIYLLYIGYLVHCVGKRMFPCCILVLHSTFLSNTCSFSFVFSFNTQVSQAYFTTGLTSTWYICSLDFLVSNLLLNRSWLA